MPIRVGFLSVAHMHAWGYAAALNADPGATCGPVWDPVPDRAATFAKEFGLETAATAEEVLASCEAVLVMSENKGHVELIERAASAGRHVLCEKPLVTSEEEGKCVQSAVERSGIKLMTAFPCRYSPAFQRLQERVAAGDIGSIRAICATNRGRCPFDWFVDVALSGGGAMIDHVVHVADLLRVLLGEEVATVHAATGNNMYGETWEDTAMLTLTFPSGIFASLDSSWSRPKSYRTWGDVTLNVVGEGGVIELDMFAQAVEHYGLGDPAHNSLGYGSGLDAPLIADFLRCIAEDTEPPITLRDGLQAVRVALAGYESSRTGQPVAPVRP